VKGDKERCGTGLDGRDKEKSDKRGKETERNFCSDLSTDCWREAQDAEGSSRGLRRMEELVEDICRKKGWTGREGRGGEKKRAFVEGKREKRGGDGACSLKKGGSGKAGGKEAGGRPVGVRGGGVLGNDCVGMKEKDCF